MKKIIYKDRNFLITEKENFRYLYLFGFFSRLAFHGLMNIENQYKLFGYEAQMGRAIIANKISRVLVIGVGAGSIIRFLKYRQPDCKITALDILPELPGLINDYFFGFLADDFRLASVVDFAEISKDEKFDLIMVDVYGADGVVAYSQSAQFLHDARRVLHPDGLLVQHYYAEPHKIGALDRQKEYREMWENYYSEIKMTGNLHDNCENLVISGRNLYF